MKKLQIEKIDTFFQKLAAEFPVYLPVDNDSNAAEFTKYAEGKVWSEQLNTVKSPKDFFFPQVENMMRFETNGKKIDVFDMYEEKEDFIIFGVRACDVRSFSILDSVYLAEPVDSFYKNRRDHGIIIAMACAKPNTTCFCENFDIDPTMPEGDITAWRTKEAVYFQANNEKGKQVLSKVSELLVEDSGEKVEEQKKSTKEILERLPFHKLDLSYFKEENTKKIFESEKWKTMSESCLGCGTCTFVCPTCQCYDIREYDTGNGIERFRCWDSCMYSDFTKMAHGNPRKSQVERFRQRFMHKLVYSPTNNEGVYGCVGCGRCVEKCPVSMNIVKVIKTLEEK
jgi:heterodisulfide reductase subunit C